MEQNLAPISVAQQLYRHDLHSFTPLVISDLRGMERRRVYRLIARLEAENLVAEVEKGKYLLFGLQPERVLSRAASPRRRRPSPSPRPGRRLARSRGRRAICGSGCGRRGNWVL